MSCTNRLDPDDPESAECGDEGRLCEECAARQTMYWAAYFGILPGMSAEQKRRRLEAFRPPNMPARDDE